MLSIVRTIHMWPLGQPHKLWLVPNFSTRGPLKPLLSFHPISCLPWYSLALIQPTEWHLKAPPNRLPAWHSLAPGIQSHLEWPLHLFTCLSTRAQGSLLLLSLTFTCKHVYIIIMNYYLVACVCRIETDSVSWFVCNWYIVCGVLCILQLCALEQLIK